jgi:hypothetical protein|tara:strand:- start:336 stop:449 length:114 start_codon:yes stop_codon:yes gene_type:complete
MLKERIEILRIRATQEANNGSADNYGVDTTKTWSRWF